MQLCKLFNHLIFTHLTLCRAFSHWLDPLSDLSLAASSWHSIAKTTSITITRASSTRIERLRVFSDTKSTTLDFNRDTSTIRFDENRKWSYLIPLVSTRDNTTLRRTRHTVSTRSITKSPCKKQSCEFLRRCCLHACRVIVCCYSRLESELGLSRILRIMVSLE